MENEIKNRVANSKIVTIDLEDFYLEGERVQLEISNWLHEGIVLIEKEFRAFVKQHDWSQYKDKFVVITCSTNAIVPGWAHMLVTVNLAPFSTKTVVGTMETLETVLFSEIIESLDYSLYKDKPVIIKGCSNKPIPENAFVLLSQKLHSVAKSIMYGEACSSVPLFKKK